MQAEEEDEAQSGKELPGPGNPRRLGALPLAEKKERGLLVAHPGLCVQGPVRGRLGAGRSGSVSPEWG